MRCCWSSFFVTGSDARPRDPALRREHRHDRFDALEGGVVRLPVLPRARPRRADSARLLLVERAIAGRRHLAAGGAGERIAALLSVDGRSRLSKGVSPIRSRPWSTSGLLTTSSSLGGRRRGSTPRLAIARAANEAAQNPDAAREGGSTPASFAGARRSRGVRRAARPPSRRPCSAVAARLRWGPGRDRRRGSASKRRWRTRRRSRRGHRRGDRSEPGRVGAVLGRRSEGHGLPPRPDHAVNVGQGERQDRHRVAQPPQEPG